MATDRSSSSTSASSSTTGDKEGKSGKRTVMKEDTKEVKKKAKLEGKDEKEGKEEKVGTGAGSRAKKGGGDGAGRKKKKKDTKKLEKLKAATAAVGAQFQSAVEFREFIAKLEVLWKYFDADDEARNVEFENPLLTEPCDANVLSHLKYCINSLSKTLYSEPARADVSSDNDTGSDTESGET